MLDFLAGSYIVVWILVHLLLSEPRDIVSTWCCLDIGNTTCYCYCIGIFPGICPLHGDLYLGDTLLKIPFRVTFLEVGGVDCGVGREVERDAKLFSFSGRHMTSGEDVDGLLLSDTTNGVGIYQKELSLSPGNHKRWEESRGNHGIRRFK